MNDTPAFKRVGFFRLMQDVLTTTGQLYCDRQGKLILIQLKVADTLVRSWVDGLAALLELGHVVVYLDKT
ncbi:MAG: hypothetical protein AAGC93_13855 [Cyanobacteria bacterium P01_F01_bin.53]